MRYEVYGVKLKARSQERKSQSIIVKQSFLSFALSHT